MIKENGKPKKAKTDEKPKKAKLEIINLDLEALVKLEGNPRRVIEPEGVKRLVGLIKKHGFQNPLQVFKEKGGKYSILCGNHRYEAGQEAGIKIFPCIEYQGTRQQAMARALSDNKSNEWTGWDYPLLKDFFTDIDDGVFDMELTGFNANEIKSIFQGGDFEPGSADEQGQLDEKEPIECPECGHIFNQ